MDALQRAAGRSSGMFRFSSARLTAALLASIEETTRFKAKEIRKLHAQFQAIADVDGKLGPAGFRASMGILGAVQDSILCQRLFAVFNESDTGLITFEEFAKGLNVLVKGSVDEKLAFAFAMTDIDGSGKITEGELEVTVDSIMRIYCGIMGSVNMATLDKARIRAMFNKLDRNKDGFITLEEYKRGMKQHPEFVSSLRGSDLFTVGQDNAIKEEQNRARRYRRVASSILADVSESMTLLQDLMAGFSSGDVSEDVSEDGLGVSALARRLRPSPLTSLRFSAPALSPVLPPAPPVFDEECATDWGESDSEEEEPAPRPAPAAVDAVAAPSREALGSARRSPIRHSLSADAWSSRQELASLVSQEDKLLTLLQSIQAKAKAVLQDGGPVKRDRAQRPGALVDPTFSYPELRASRTGRPLASYGTTASSDAPAVGATRAAVAQDTGRAFPGPGVAPSASEAAMAAAEAAQEAAQQAQRATEPLSRARERPSLAEAGAAPGEQGAAMPEATEGAGAADGAADGAETSVAVETAARTEAAAEAAARARVAAGHVRAAMAEDDAASAGALHGEARPPAAGSADEEGRVCELDSEAEPDESLLKRYLMSAQKGSTVFFGHKNWDLVLNVMKGIQMAVGRSAAEAARPLNTVDFSVKEKYTLVAGSKLGSHGHLGRTAGVGARNGFGGGAMRRSARAIDRDATGRSCRFVDYAPVVFCKLREHFGIRNEDYVHSIGPGNMLSNLMLGSLSSLAELGSEGKSGSFFYFTSDGQFMVKTVRKEEHKLLRSILPQYYYHMTRSDASESLLCRIVGSHVVRLSKNSKIGANKIYFVVMTNTLNTDLDLTRRFDLKGSWISRKEGDAARQDPKATLKDTDLRELGQRIRVGPERRAKLLESLSRDASFLESNHIIDYSLLLGVHVRAPERKAAGDAAEGGGKSLRKQLRQRHGRAATARMFGRRLSLSSAVSSESAEADSSGSAQDEDDDDDEGSEGAFVPFFQEDDGGMRSVDGQETYVMGVIDFLTLYSTRKVAERLGKSCFYNSRGISVQPPARYAKRFVDFMASIIE